MDAEHPPRCPNCDRPTHAVKLLYQSGPHAGGGLEYGSPEARPSFWNGKFKAEGTVLTFLCESCGRIQMFGERVEKA